MLQFQQSETTSERRRWLFQLKAAPVNNEVPTGAINGVNQTYTLASTPLANSLKFSWNGQLLVDGGVDYTRTGTTIVMVGTPQVGDTLLASYEVTSLTGQTGTGFISKNGGAAVATTNSMVEVSSGSMPGLYYIEMTAAELNTLGFVSLYVKTATSIAITDTALVSYNDPYVSVGGFSGGGGKGGIGLTKKQLDMIAELVWKYKFRENVTAQDELTKAAEHPVVDLTGLENKVNGIVIPEIDLRPVLDKIDGIEFPKQRDYTEMLNSLNVALKNFENVSTKNLQQTIKEFEAKMSVATKDINGSLSTVKEIKEGFEGLRKATGDFTDKVSEMSDMDKRFENMTSTMQKQQLDELVKKIDKMMKEILIKITDQKYDILQELSK